MRRQIIVWTLFFLLTMASVALGIESAGTMISRSADNVLKILKDPQLNDESALVVKKEKLWMIIDEVFDYQRLSQYALGRQWRKITPDQQAEFSQVYARLLGKTYMDRILDYGNENIVIGKEVALSEKVAEVQTTIFSQGRGIPVHYRLMVSNGQWRVFDVIIEGISLTKNYRSQFKKFLTRNSMDKLLAVLEKKTRGVRNSK